MNNQAVRSGWNTRGGTAKEHLRLERELDSHWKYVAETELGKLADLMADYEGWMELTWPGDVIDHHSYKEIYEVAHAKLETLETCTCKPGDTMACPACQAYLENAYPDELPY